MSVTLCAKCRYPFDVPGGLIFGVPQIMTPLVAGVTKTHLCPNCVGLLNQWLAQPLTAGKAKPSATRPNEVAAQEHVAFITFTRDQTRMTCGTCGLFVTMMPGSTPDAARLRLQELHAK